MDKFIRQWSLIKEPGLLADGIGDTRDASGAIELNRRRVSRRIHDRAHEDFSRRAD